MTSDGCKRGGFSQQTRSRGLVWLLLTVFLLVPTPLWAQQLGTWSPAADLNQARAGHTATLLPDGKVLIAGGKDAAGQALATAELYDPSTGEYAQVSASLPVAVWGHTASLLQDNKVLIAGGKDSAGNPVASLQLFDAAAGGFTALPPMSRPRSQHTATLLKDGRVLIAGGTDGQGALPGLEIYDPGFQMAFLAPATLRMPRQNHTATLLWRGRVLIVGGSNSSGVLGSAEIYNPDDGTVAQAGSMAAPRTLASAALLLDGSVLVAGGQDAQGQDLNSAEIYKPAANAFTPAAAMSTPRSGHAGLRLLHNGKVLVAGGTNAGELVPSVEVYDPVTGTFWGVASPSVARKLFGANFFAETYAGVLLASGGTGSTQDTMKSSEFFYYPTVRTDKPDYQPGDTVTVMGERWLPNETVTINIRESSGDPDTTLTATTDASGFFSISQFQMNSLDKGVRFLVTVTGRVSRWTAQARFTDSDYNLDQCENGPLGSSVPCSGNAWVNGNLNGSKAHYLEGQSVPYRLRMTDLTIGSHTLTIEWDTTQQGKHAIDYLTSFNRTETTADPCSGVTGCNPAAPNTYAIPTDPNVAGSGVTQIPGFFKLYGGTITGVSSYTLNAPYTGSSSTSITITFTASVPTPVLAWGGHIATRLDWGQNNSAVSISGSPFHMRILGLDGRGGNQDRSLTNDAVIFPGSITIVKKANPQDTASFSFTSPDLELGSFSLADDGTTANTKVFSNLTNFNKTYTVTETVPSDWKLDSIVCVDPSGNSTGSVSTASASINLAEAEDITCTFTNSRKQGTFKIIKHVVNDNGGTKAAGDFTMTVSGTAVPNGSISFPGAESPGTAVALNGGSYGVTESGPSGYAATYSGDCSGSILPGETKTCTVTNDDQSATLTIRKVVVNDNGGTKTASNFSFSVNGGSAVAFNANGENQLTVSAGTYNVIEPAVSGYTTSYDNCSNLIIPNGGSATCTITNDDQPGTLIVKKVVKNDNGGTKGAADFSFQVGSTSPVAFSQDSDVLHGKNTLTVSAGTYTITEPAVSGYTTTYDNCSGVVVANGGTQTCTITNDDQPGTLIVKKVVKNDNGGTKGAADFSFQVNGGAAVAFNANGENQLTVSAGTYSVTEPAVSGYTTSYSNCSNLVIPNGGSATCTITNDDQPATLIVKKVVVNDNGGTKTANNFSFSVSGGAAVTFNSNGENQLTVNAGTYSVTEPAVSGYTTSYDNCSKLVIPNGGSATCTITNDDNPSSLILKKVVTNDNGGSALPTAWTLSAAGPTPLSGPGPVVSSDPATFKAGTYTLSESGGPAGYTASAWSCVGGTQNGSQITLGLGESATCTITNDDQPAKLIVKKHVINDNNGTKVAGDFTMQVTGSSPSPASFPGSEAGTTVTLNVGNYSVTEAGPSGYEASYSADCSGTIALGETKTCTVTNDDIQPKLTVTKVVVNDNGGTKQVSDFTLKVGSATVASGAQNGFNAGSYTVSETGPSGYAATFSGDCDASGKVTLSVGDVKSCTITNDDIQPKLTVIKMVVPSSDTGKFNLLINGTPRAMNVGHNGSTGAVGLDAGTYTVSETAGDGTDLAGYITPVIGGDCDSSGSVTLNAGDNKTCIITNTKRGAIVIYKRTVGGDGTFSFTGKGTDFPTSLSIATSGGLGSQTYTPAPGSYTVNETVPPGWDFTSLNCSASGSSTYSIKSQEATINLAAGEAVSCTYTNTKKGHLIVQKTTVPAGDPTVFSITASGNGTITGGGAGTVTDALDKDYEVTPGTYSVAEVVPAGWVQTGDTCQNVVVGAGETKTCTITNTKLATLVIEKVALGVSAATFNFTATGDGLESLFTINGGSKKIFTNLMPGGSRTVAEGALPSHWDFTSLSCQTTVIGDGTTSAYTSGPTATITNLGAGATLTCTYTNTERGKIKIIKGAVGGEGTDTFNFSSTGGLPSPAVDGNFSLTPPKGGTASVTFSDLKPGKYSVTEDTTGFGTGLTDWKLASVVCSASGSGSNGTQDAIDPTKADIIVGAGGSVTCTFTNVRGSTYVTDTMFCALPNDQFRLIYQPDAVNYTLTASNPGQFYDNVFYQGPVGSSVAFKIGIPYPFVTHGAVPIQVHSSVTVTESGCLVPVGDLTSDPTTTITVSGANGVNNSLSSSGNPVIVLGDYGTSPTVGETPTTVAVSATTPSTGLVYVTIHLDYGMKGKGGWSKGTNDLATNKSLFASWPVSIADPQKYSFSSTVSDGGAGNATLMESVSSVNDFKRNLGIAGQVTKPGSPVEGVNVRIIDPNGTVIGTVVTDADGWYVFSYKYTGKEAVFTVELPEYGKKMQATLKSNSFARVDFIVP